MRTRSGDETRERFLAAIAEKVPADAVVEVHLFQPIRQSGFESGVAVVAVEEGLLSHAEGATENSSRTGGEAAAENRPAPRSGAAENNQSSAENRLAIHTARYRLTQKGAERGKWEFDIQADADAPLITVDKVVRGVQRRSGDAEEPERLSGDDFRALLPPREPAEGPSV